MVVRNKSTLVETSLFLSSPLFLFHLLFAHSLLIVFFLSQFNCFLLMPVVDKLPALLREDLESAFEDDLDYVFDITNLRHSLGQRKRDAEIEMKRVFNLLLVLPLENSLNS